MLCPKCGADTFHETTLAEWCDTCGYWYYYGA